MTTLSASQWDDFLTSYPDAHLLQSSAWGQLKSAFGWEVVRVIAGEGTGKKVGAQVLFRRLPFGFCVAYIPKGPVSKQVQATASIEEWAVLWAEIDVLCRNKKAIFLKVEPDLWEPPSTSLAGDTTPLPVSPILILTNDQGEPIPIKPSAGFQAVGDNIQPQRTLLISLRGGEERILGRMKQKTRYNIRLALKRGVVVRKSAELEIFHQLMKVTGGRDRFDVHSLDYYQRAYDLFHPYGMCELFLAELQGEPLAALMAFARGKRAWYFYGASSDEHRDAMPTYLLQWEAMRWASSIGCAEYDLWGVPDEREDILETSFSTRSDGLWGVYRFKRGFGGHLYRAVPSWEKVYQPVLYKLYHWWIGRRFIRRA